MKPADLLSLLQDLHRDKLALRQRHVAVARLVSDYDVNNTYQYVVAREEFHLRWLRSAVADLGGTTGDVPEPQVQASGRGDDRWKALAREDAEEAVSFVERWTPRVAAITHDRDRKMCQVVLGETLEHRRFFAQAAAGRSDLLGRRRS